MLISFFQTLKKTGIPVSVKEYLMLLEALNARVAFASVDDFYLLSRACLTKTRSTSTGLIRHLLRGSTRWKALMTLSMRLFQKIGYERELEKYLTEEEKAKIESLGLEKLLENS